MNRSRVLPLLLLVLAVPRTAAAGEDRPDTSSFYSSHFRPSLTAGVSWMQSPQRVRDRYSAGVALGGALSVRLTPRLRVAGELEYLDLPNGSQGYLGSYYSTPGGTTVSPLYTLDGTGNGHAIDVLATASLRVWRNLSLEAGGGQGYFDSGYPKIQFIDGATGQYVRIPGESGQGALITAGASYDWAVRKRERLFASVRWVRMDRGAEQLDFVPIRIGWRFE